MYASGILYGGKQRGFLSRAVLLILVIGLAIRFILLPLLTYPYDIWHWALVMQNSESGSGLFDISAYYYTPPWGYYLNFESWFLNAFLAIGEYGERFADLIGIEMAPEHYYTATTVSPAFLASIKLVLIGVDVVVGYLLFRLVLDDTGDQKKATVAFGLWFLCLPVIYMSSIQATFDCICALLTLLSLYFLKTDRCFWAGALLALAGLTKFFPAFLIFLFVAYVYAQHRADGKWKKMVVQGILGAVIMTVILLLPQMFDGTLQYDFTFVTDRSSTYDLLGTISMCLYLALLLLVMIGTALRMSKMSAEEAKGKLIPYSLAVLAAAVFMNVGPQYAIVFLPLLAYMSATSGKRYYLICFIIITVCAVTAGFLHNNMSLLTVATEYYDIWDVDSLLESMGIVHDLKQALVNWLNFFQRVAIALLLVLLWNDEYKGDKFPKLRMYITAAEDYLNGRRAHEQKN
jgi:hypothetical protein